VEADLRAVVEVDHAAGALVKVIFENHYLAPDEIVRACHLTEAAGGDFVKTSTGFAARGATHDDLRLMRASTSPHVQAKDLWIDREGLYENGVFSMGMGWQVPRLPGLGDVDWAALFGALWRTGYDGDVIIEHEDRDFEKTDELVKRGFLLARDVLRPYIK
jgi:sugar phosphate isomerase/epimerase